MDPESRGDPESPLRWTTKSTRHLAAALTVAGHPVSAPTVAALLKEESFSLQGNVKTLEGARHADRDAQFRYINAQARDHIDAGDPVISVDAKKKENVGPFKKGGAEWQPKGAPEPVNVHDFIDKELGKVTPSGCTTWPATRLGERGHRPRHGRLRGGHDPHLVGGPARPPTPMRGGC